MSIAPPQFHFLVNVSYIVLSYVEKMTKNPKISWLTSVVCALILMSSCKKDEPTSPSGSNSCELRMVSTSVFGNESTDSLFYANGKLSRITQHSANAAIKTINYSYFGLDSVHITENGSLSTVFYFDAQSRLTGIRYLTSDQTLQFQYNSAGTAGDSIRIRVAGETSAFATLFRNPQGNITYTKSLIEGDLHESYYTYDTKPNVFKPLLHFGNMLYTLSSNNQLRYTTYENGVLAETIDFNLSYTASNQLSSMAFLEGAIRYDFSYQCP